MYLYLCSFLSRRLLLSPIPLIVLGLLFPAFNFATGQTTLAISIRTLSSPYQVMYKVGAESYAKQVNLPLDVLTTEANSQKGLTDIKSEVARRGGNVAFFIDPNDASDAVPIAKALEPAGGFLYYWWGQHTTG